MAEAIFEMIGNSGSLLISSDAIHPAYRGKQSVTITQQNEGRPQRQFDSRSLVFSGCKNPVFAIVGDPAVFLGRGSVQSDGRCTVSVSAANDNVEPGGTIGKATVFHFDVPDDSGSIGLWLYDEAGQCTFNSNARQMFVVRAVASETSAAYNAPNGKRYAFSPTDWLHGTNGYDEDAPHDIYPIGPAVSEGGITYFDGGTRFRNDDWSQASAGWSSGSSDRNLVGGGVIIDVTGL